MVQVQVCWRRGPGKELLYIYLALWRELANTLLIQSTHPRLIRVVSDSSSW
jgi:hypothetical protein